MQEQNLNKQHALIVVDYIDKATYQLVVAVEHTWPVVAAAVDDDDGDDDDDADASNITINNKNNVL